LRLNFAEMDYRILGKQYALPLDSGSKTRNDILLCATLLFAQKGYVGVSVGDLVRHIGIKPSSLYNHFSSKEELWKAVVLHTERLYTLYFDLLDEELSKAESFAQTLEIIFREPKTMENQFTCFAFSLLYAEQLREECAWDVVRRIFLDKSIRVLTYWFDRCVARGYVRPFKTRPVATQIMHTVLGAVCMEAQRLMGRATPYDPKEMMEETQDELRQALLGA
jgi:AcrR family transcriptional regulator